MAWVPVEDEATQTMPGHVVVNHDIRSLMDATISLHNQRILDKERWLASKQYCSRAVPKTRIKEVQKNGDGLDINQRQDVIIRTDFLHEPAEGELNQPHRVAIWPNVMKGEYGRKYYQDNGCEEMTFAPLVRMHEHKF